MVWANEAPQAAENQDFASYPARICFMMPDPMCDITLHLDFGAGGGMAWGKTATSDPTYQVGFAHLFIDVGVLWALTSGPTFQLGPTIVFETQFLPESTRYHLIAHARGRLWAGDFITLEAAGGLIGAVNRGCAPQFMGGVSSELAITLAGHLGFYIQSQHLFISDGLEIRVMGGLRGSPLGWLLFLLAI